MTQKRGDAPKASGGSVVLSSTIRCYLLTVDSGIPVQMERKFDLCFTIVKQGTPLIIVGSH